MVLISSSGHVPHRDLSLTLGLILMVPLSSSINSVSPYCRFNFLLIFTGMTTSPFCSFLFVAFFHFEYLTMLNYVKLSRILMFLLEQQNIEILSIEGIHKINISYSLCIFYDPGAVR